MNSVSNSDQPMEEHYEVPNSDLSQFPKNVLESQIIADFQSLPSIADAVYCLNREIGGGNICWFETYCFERFGLPPSLVRVLLETVEAKQCAKPTSALAQGEDNSEVDHL